ncbi:hypothetical protein OG563_09455 [Nocardia vinacea]|uniref:FtsK domain-containing protein n=1 Tax=Nocardia vinacea TaxID=96468 RepID=A0ABZ1Z2V3_9NOCA|nr:hypothetical protein [Nocardia vinacea]
MNAVLIAATAAVPALSTAYAGAWSGGFGPGYWTAKDVETRRAYRAGVRIRRGWKPLARRLRLVLRDVPRPSHGGPAQPGKIHTPKMRRLKADEFGVTADFQLCPTIRLEDFQANAADLRNAWNMVRVAVEQTEPNKVTVRAVRRDPLRVKTAYAPSGTAPDLRHYVAGLDAFGREARIRLHHGSGLCVYGLPNYGKTSFILGLITHLAPSDSVQFLVADGKSTLGTDGDYMDVAPRALSVIGDDIYTFNQLVRELETMRQMRAATIRQALGVRNFWDVGPSPEWPLIMFIVDEAHTYFEQTSAYGNPETQQRNAVAADNAARVAGLVRKCQAVGILPVLTTQKGTSDAIPSMISANAHASACFAVKTDEAAQAALGPDIHRHSDQSPISLQHEDFVGVMTMLADHRAGYTQVRTPYCAESVAAQVCEQYAHLVRSEVVPSISVGMDHRAFAADGGDAVIASLLAKS